MPSAVVEKNTNVVVNKIVADAAISLPPDSCYLVDITDLVCDIGWIYDPENNAFTNPNPPPEPEVTTEEPVI